MNRSIEFLLKCEKRKLPAHVLMAYVDQMTGKTDEEKEQLAARFIEEIDAMPDTSAPSDSSKRED